MRNTTRSLVVFASALFVLSAVACSSGGGGESSSGGSDACNAACDAKAAGCAQMDLSTCKQLCALQGSKCTSEFQTENTCFSKAQWKCSATVTIDGKPAAEQVDPTQCQAEKKAFQDCEFGTAGDAG